MTTKKQLREEIKKFKKEHGRGILIIIGSKNFRHGTGRSKIAKTLAEKINATHFSTGDEFRKKAKKKRMNINQYAKYVENHPQIDKKFDEENKEKVKKTLNKKENVVADSNLLNHFMKADISIAIDTTDKIRAERVYRKHREGDEKFKNPKETLQKLKERDKIDQKRYEKLYGINSKKLTETYDAYINNNGPLEETMKKVIEKTYEKLKGDTKWEHSK